MVSLDVPPPLPSHVPLKVVLATTISLVSGAFSAGVTYQVAKDSARAEIAAAVEPAISAAKAAQSAALAQEGEIRALQADLARGIGRCLSSRNDASARDWAGKTAKQFFERELGEGVPRETALQHVMESDF